MLHSKSLATLAAAFCQGLNEISIGIIKLEFSQGPDWFGSFCALMIAIDGIGCSRSNGFFFPVIVLVCQNLIQVEVYTV